MALDVGDTMVGVAVSDELGVLATPRPPFRRRSQDDAERLAAMVVDWGVSAVVVGLPRNMDGSEGPQARKVREFADRLAAIVPVPLYFWDERLSTREALGRLVSRGARAARRRQEVDGEAASIILEGYLRRMNQRTDALTPSGGDPAVPRDPTYPQREEGHDERQG